MCRSPLISFEPLALHTCGSLIPLVCEPVSTFDRDLKTEPDRIRAFYEVRAKRVEPIGLAYLWPDTG